MPTSLFGVCEGPASCARPRAGSRSAPRWVVPEPVRDDCSEQLNEVQKLLPTVVFEVRSVDGADETDVRVNMDGAPLATKLDGQAMAVDPGQHTFRFEADGFAPVDLPLLVREADKARRGTWYSAPSRERGLLRRLPPRRPRSRPRGPVGCGASAA